MDLVHQEVDGPRGFGKSLENSGEVVADLFDVTERGAVLRLPRQLPAPARERIERVLDVAKIVERFDLRDEQLAGLINEIIQFFGLHADAAERGAVLRGRRSTGAREIGRASR